MTKTNVDWTNFHFTHAIENAASHLEKMADTLSRAADEMRRRANDMRMSGAAEMRGEEASQTWAMSYYSWGINDWTNVQTNLRLDLVPNHTAALVLTRPCNNK